MILRKIKYIAIGIFEGIWHDFKVGYDDMGKPKEILNLLFLLMIVLLLTKQNKGLLGTAILYVVVYIWKIIRQGYWKKRMNDS